MVTFEEYAALILNTTARGRPIKWNEDKKEFQIEIYPWFTRTFPFWMLWEAWEGKA